MIFKHIHASWESWNVSQEYLISAHSTVDYGSALNSYFYMPIPKSFFAPPKPNVFAFKKQH